MTVHGSSAIALYTGDARLWQDANAVEAQSIEFDRDHRSMIALGSDASRTVSTVLVQAELAQQLRRKITSACVSCHHFYASRLTPTPSAKRISRATSWPSDGHHHHSEKDGRVSRSTWLVQANLYPQRENWKKSWPHEQVVITQPERRAIGDLLVYTAADDKFVLTGGPPSIFDAEHGKITGVSLTFFRHDDRVLVEGNNSSPTVTQTRVAR